MWTITEDTFLPGKLRHKETLFTIGNGYLSTRGTFDEEYPDECRATFIHGVFDDVPIFITELANAPDWLAVEILVDGEPFAMSSGTIEEYTRSIDLQNGLLTRKLKWTSPAGKSIHLAFERFTSLADEHLLCLRIQAVPDYHGTLEFRLGIDGNVTNLGYSHWEHLGQGQYNDDVVYLHSRTRSTAIELAMAMRLITSHPPRQNLYIDGHGHPARSLIFTADPGKEVSIEKVVGVATSRDTVDALKMAVDHAYHSPPWERAFEDNCKAWQEEWERTDILVEGDDDAQIAIRFSLFQLLIAAPRHDNRVNIGAKTLSGYGYRGHSFWDTEIFMLPVFIYTAPHIARNLLEYRYQRLDAARHKAEQNGYQGAQFPWESADTGEEVTPRWIPDFTGKGNAVRIWTGDIEIHISADIAYAAYLYWKTSGDDRWMIEKGAELILETAKFWASRAEWNAKTQTYDYSDVIGPDEYHDHVDNNFYTNYMARWNLKTALEIIGWLNDQAPNKARELTARLKITPDLLQTWKDVIAAIRLSVKEDGLIEQFDSYFQLQDIDLGKLEPRSVSAQALFGIEGVSKTQILKQPDVLMLLYVLRGEFDEGLVRVNHDYYTPRTDLTFGSSLGPSIQSAITCKLRDCISAYEHFVRAANADLRDVRGNAGDGIHGASAGGIWQSVVFGFAGLKVFSDHWEVSPCLPEHWKRLKFHFYYHGKQQTVDIKN